MGNHIFELGAAVTRRPVSYENRFGITIVADLYLPEGFDESRAYPAATIGSPYGGVKEQGAGVYAKNMAERGFVALAFDPSFNGYSGGEPRHVSSPDIFVEDFSAAVDFLGTRGFVDRERIGVIGMCGSGGFALSAAQVDPRIKAVATVSMYDMSRVMAKGFMDSMSDAERTSILAMIADQRYADFEGGVPALTPRGAPLQITEDMDPVGREFAEFYSTPRGYHPNSISQFTVTSTASFMNFSLLDNLVWISPRPILLVMGEHAHSRYFSEDVYEAAAEPKELYVVPEAGHVDLYDRTDKIPFDKLEMFFSENL